MTELLTFLDHVRAARAKPVTLPLGVALFHGPIGSGKAKAALAIARELDTEILRIDLSAVVSKYIGETEKHIDAVLPSGLAQSCCWTRRMLYSASARKFGIRTIVTRTARCPTCFSASRLSKELPSSRPMRDRTSTRHSCAGCGS